LLLAPRLPALAERPWAELRPALLPPERAARVRLAVREPDLDFRGDMNVPLDVR
jgi:hypothetical protein